MEELKKIFIRIASILFIAFLPCSGLLIVYFYTAPIITEYYDIKEKRAVLDIFHIPYRTIEKTVLGFTIKSHDNQNIRDVFQESITVEEPSVLSFETLEDDQKEKPVERKRVFKYVKDEKLQGLGFVETKMGYGYNKSSPMSLFICLEPDMETIKGIEVLDHGETPGLGGRMTEEQFKNQFIGKKLKPKIRMMKDAKATGPNEFDAITGATNTSRGVEEFLNDAVKEFREGQGEMSW
ncbi:MAG: FMN-binding protein [Candidatus Brocadiaceae bacterium]|nr:FMN-binding protein [Candidatus Brocadiaceae bacterium]